MHCLLSESKGLTKTHVKVEQSHDEKKKNNKHNKPVDNETNYDEEKASNRYFEDEEITEKQNKEDKVEQEINTTNKEYMKRMRKQPVWFKDYQTSTSRSIIC